VIADVADGVDAAEFRVGVEGRAPRRFVRPPVANADNKLAAMEIQLVTLLQKGFPKWALVAALITWTFAAGAEKVDTRENRSEHRSSGFCLAIAK